MEQQIQPLETASAISAETHVADELTAVQSEAVVSPLSQEELEALNVFLHSQAHKARWFSRFRIGFICAWVVWFLLTGILSSQGKHLHLFSVSMQILNLLGLFVASRFGSERHKRAIAMLTKTNDARFIGTLAEALILPSPEMKVLAGNALALLLPHLRATDASLLNDRQRDHLRPLLKQQRKPLILALLHAYEQVGDGRDLPAVQALLAGKGKLAKDPEVRAAAEACLPFLEVSARRRQAQQTLLRAAEQPLASPEELLRPAQTGPQTVPEQLLRATDER